MPTSLSVATRTASPQIAPETGSQTTEYALIMVVTVTKLRGYDDDPLHPSTGRS